MRQMVLKIFHFKVRNLSNTDVAITDAMLQDIEKMKVQYLMSLLFDVSEILQAVRSEQTNFAWL